VGIEENEDRRLRLNVIGASNEPDRVLLSFDVVPVVLLVAVVNVPAGGAVGGKLTT
jgi:hypothetical protein